jgi:hypothetical protein
VAFHWLVVVANQVVFFLLSCINRQDFCTETPEAEADA